MLLLSFSTFILIALKTMSFYYLNKNKSTRESISDSLIFIPNIALQQIILFLFWMLLLKNNFILNYQILIAGFLFSLCHLYLFNKLNKSDATLITLFSFLGGIVFVYLYSQYNYGIWLAFLIHLAYHTILDLIFIFLKLKPMKYRK
jgi:hypothetical protein